MDWFRYLLPRAGSDLAVAMGAACRDWCVLRLVFHLLQDARWLNKNRSQSTGLRAARYLGNQLSLTVFIYASRGFFPLGSKLTLVSESGHVRKGQFRKNQSVPQDGPRTNLRRPVA